MMAGTFCYVFNARQMTRRLLAQGIRGAFLDMTRIGSETVSISQWYGIKAQTGLQVLKRNDRTTDRQELASSSSEAQSPNPNETLRQQVELTLQQAVYGATESNRISGFKNGVNSVAVSPNGAYIATASLDGSVQLWRSDGSHLVTMQGHSDLPGVLPSALIVQR
jgi:hypothetical protein